jgi:hypothetical protein
MIGSEAKGTGSNAFPYNIEPLSPEILNFTSRKVHVNPAQASFPVFSFLTTTITNSSISKNRINSTLQTRRMATNAQPTFFTLPPELHLKIFKFLDPISSTCLGVCAKKFYAIHTSLNNSVPLLTYVALPITNGHGMHLFELLDSWMKPYDFCIRKMKFVTKARPMDVVRWGGALEAAYGRKGSGAGRDK